MTLQTKTAALDTLTTGMLNLIDNYTVNALLLNACDVARKRYALIPQVILSTTVNIPLPLRLEMEMDMQFTGTELVQEYQSNAVEAVFSNYLVTAVSKTDAVIEDLYEVLVKADTPGISDAALEKTIRDAWTNNNMLNYFTNPNGLNLKKPDDLNTEFDEAFMRYLELRLVRHSVLHTNAILSVKNKAKLEEFHARTPKERQHFALLNAPFFDKDGKITLSLNTILSFRQYLYRFMMYLRSSISQLEAANP